MSCAVPLRGGCGFGFLVGTLNDSGQVCGKVVTNRQRPKDQRFDRRYQRDEVVGLPFLISPKQEVGKRVEARRDQEGAVAFEDVLIPSLSDYLRLSTRFPVAFLVPTRNLIRTRLAPTRRCVA